MKQFKAFERKSCKDLRSHVIDIDQQTFQIDAAVERREGLELDGQFTGMADRKIEMDAVRSAEFKEAFDEFDKVRVTTAGEEKSISNLRTTVAPSHQRSCWECSEPWDRTRQKMSF